MKLSLIIPCFNEEASLPALLARIEPVVREGAFAGNVELIAVDDGSADRTWSILEELAQRYSFLVPIRHAQNRGLPEAWRTGAMAAMTDIYRACAVAESTPFYDVIEDLVRRELIVGSVITNNFDCLCADRGLQEISLRHYDWGPYYPEIDYDPRAKSLLVVGVHADRRLVQMRARDRGLKVVFVDPERYVGPDGRAIEYPVEAPQNQDFFVRATAEEALPRLHRYLLK